MALLLDLWAWSDYKPFYEKHHRAVEQCMPHAGWEEKGQRVKFDNMTSEHEILA